VVFELKELAKDKSFEVADSADPNMKCHSRTIGNRVRDRIDSSRKQIRYGAEQGLPSVLLIYNNLDPVFQRFGTEDMDFTTAMYGELTMLLNKQTGAASELFNGRSQSLQKNKNTSFSAVGRLCDTGGETTVTLFENVFAAVKLSYERLPSCFDVRRIQVLDEPLILP
jgi:hypothetical protein